MADTVGAAAVATKGATPRSRHRVSGATEVVVIITAVAIAIRWALMDQSIFGDELFTYEVATRPGIGSVVEGVRSALEVTPPLYFLVAWTAQKVGDPVLWLRMPALVAGVATVPAVYVLGLRTVGRDAALVAAALFALSPFAVWYATEARAYSLMALLVVLVALALLRAVETDDWRWWATCSVLVAATMYTHYTSVFVLLSQLVWVLIAHRRRIRPLLVAYAGAALLFLPWLPDLIDDQRAPIQAATHEARSFTPASAGNDLIQLTVGNQFTSLRELPGAPALLLLAAALGLGLGGLAWRWVKGPRPTVTPPALLVVMMAAAAPVAIGIYSLQGTSLFVPRNLMSSLPAIVLVVAALLVALPRRLAAVAVLLALAGLALGDAALLKEANQRPAYDQAADFIESRAGAGDVVLQTRPGVSPSGDALEVYLDPEIPLFRFADSGDALRALEKGDGRLFYVRPLNRSVSEPDHQFAVDHGLRLVEQQTWDGMLLPVTVSVYERR